MTVKLVSPKFEKPDTERGNGLSYRALQSTTKAESADLRETTNFLLSFNYKSNHLEKYKQRNKTGLKQLKQERKKTGNQKKNKQANKIQNEKSSTKRQKEKKRVLKEIGQTN